MTSPPFTCRFSYLFLKDCNFTFFNFSSHHTTLWDYPTHLWLFFCLMIFSKTFQSTHWWIKNKSFPTFLLISRRVTLCASVAFAFHAKKPSFTISSISWNLNFHMRTPYVIIFSLKTGRLAENWLEVVLLFSIDREDQTKTLDTNLLDNLNYNLFWN